MPPKTYIALDTAMFQSKAAPEVSESSSTKRPPTKISLSKIRTKATARIEGYPKSLQRVFHLWARVALQMGTGVYNHTPLSFDHGLRFRLAL